MSALLTHPHWPVPIQVKRSERARRMSLKIDPSQRMATLVLPPRVSERVAMAFIADHIGWLESRLAALPTPIPFLPGTEIPLLGEAHLLQSSPGARRGVWIEDGTIQVSGPLEFFSRRVGDFLKAEAKRRILARAEAMTAQLDLDFKSVRVGDPKSRWGSCNSRGTLAFSWRLVLTPDPVLTYVVAHEVAHLKEMNHSPRFWAWVKSLTPDYEKQRRWLKTNGAALYRYGMPALSSVPGYSGE
jgi:predicted metal-dependent hydrolase